MEPDFSRAVDLSALKGRPNVTPMQSQQVDEEEGLHEDHYKWEEAFFAVMMWPDRAPVPTDTVGGYADAVRLAKNHRPACDVFEVKKVTRRVGGRMG